MNCFFLIRTKFYNATVRKEFFVLTKWKNNQGSIFQTKENQWEQLLEVICYDWEFYWSQCSPKLHQFSGEGNRITPACSNVTEMCYIVIQEKKWVYLGLIHVLT